MLNYTSLGTSRKCCFSVSQFFGFSLALQHQFQQAQRTAGFSDQLTALIKPVLRKKHQNPRHNPVWNQTQPPTGQEEKYTE